MNYLGQGILFLDDNEERIQAVRARWPAATVVKTAAECIAALKAGKFITLMLDFDLDGDEKGNNYNLETSGAEVARWVIANKPDVVECIAHSHNVPMGQRMALELRRAGYQSYYVPFGSGRLLGAER